MSSLHRGARRWVGIARLTGADLREVRRNERRTDGGIQVADWSETA